MSCSRLIPILLFLLMALGCHEEKTISLQGDQPVAPKDFIEFFEPLTLPFTLADTALASKPSDSLGISLINLGNMLPDSVIGQLKKKGTTSRFYAIGKLQVPDGETYLLIRQQVRSVARVLVLAYTPDNRFLASLSTVSLPRTKDLVQSLQIDRRFVFTIVRQRKNSDGSASEGKEVFVLNQEARLFTLIMTEALDEKPTELINPIDTLSATHRHAGDYTNGKFNLVSVRDGRKPDRISFFVYFETKNGACVGELKGEALWKAPRLAVYRQDGDPCVLEFQFTAGAVNLREHRCGSRRGPDCLFDGSFVRRKKPRIKKKG
ncbi:MAG: hypothetical protein ACKO41_02850 [Sphingomonadales bacterium]